MFPNTLTDKLPQPVIRQACELTPEERLELFLQYTQKAQTLWMLKGEQGFVMLEQQDQVQLPLWPHRDLAEAWAQVNGQQAEAESVELTVFTQTWLPGLATNRTPLVVFPVGPQQDVLVVEAGELLDAFNDTPDSQVAE